MMNFAAPRTYRIVSEGIANNYMEYPHFRAFIETDSDSPTVMMTINHVTEAHKVDFESAMGGTRQDDGRTGVLVYLRWSDMPRMGDSVTLSVWQADATSYESAEPLPETGFDPENPTGALLEGAIAAAA